MAPSWIIGLTVHVFRCSSGMRAECRWGAPACSTTSASERDGSSSRTSCSTPPCTSPTRTWCAGQPSQVPCVIPVQPMHVWGSGGTRAKVLKAFDSLIRRSFACWLPVNRPARSQERPEPSDPRRQLSVGPRGQRVLEGTSRVHVQRLQVPG